MTGEGGVIARLRRPEYTGENRCMACTVVNVGFAALLSLQIAFWGTVAGAPGIALAAAIALLAASLSTIWLRGYLVPGTPAFTPYLPDRVLELFDENRLPVVAPGLHGRGRTVSGAVDATDGFEPVTVLRDAKAVPRDDPHRITDAFREAWDQSVTTDLRAESHDRSTRIAECFAVDEGVTVDEDQGKIVARTDDTRVGVWESALALDADLAAAGLLDERSDEWDDLTAARQGRCCLALRARRDACPACGESLSTGPDTAESCCASREIVAAECVPCGAKLLDAPVGSAAAAVAAVETRETSNPSSDRLS